VFQKELEDSIAKQGSKHQLMEHGKFVGR